MATEQDLEKETEEEGSEESSSSADEEEAKKREADARNVSAAPSDDAEEASDDVGPVQLGYKRFVYAAYMAGAMLAAFLAAKIGHVGWYRLGQWKPELGEPRDEILFPIAGVIGVLVALYYWRKPSSRQYANEVAEELSKVTWPNRKEVTSSTTVVILTTVFATAFFALMDQFWRYVTDKIYSF